MNNNTIFFTDLKGTSVRGADSDKTGSLDDAVLDLQSGKIAFYTLGSGGFLGMGEEKIALPPNALLFSQGEARLNTHEAYLHQAPGAGSAFPETFDSNYIDDLYRHYGYKPFSAT